jgi:hypothetical protein
MDIFTKPRGAQRSPAETISSQNKPYKQDMKTARPILAGIIIEGKG